MKTIKSVIAETEISICDYNDCSQGAQCIPDSSKIGYRCECKPVVIDGNELKPIGDGFSCSLSLSGSTSGETSGGTSGGIFAGTSGSSSGGQFGATSLGELNIQPGVDLKPIVTLDGPTLFYTLRWDFKLIPFSAIEFS